MDFSFELDVAFCCPGLIVLDGRGAVYKSQVFGHGCQLVSARGFFVPLEGSPVQEGREEPLEEALGALLADACELSESMADEVDLLMARYTDTSGLRVDRAMLASSGEAWVHVDILYGNSVIHGDGPWKGVLTWANSD